MYETIQGLPLFKGTTTDQISSFLEKTNVEFVNFRPGHVLAEAGKQCADLRFVISGRVRSCMSLSGGRASLVYVSGYGTVLSPCCLFGLHTHYPVSVESVDEGSYMLIRKDQYLELLQTDTIYLLNYLNYLGFHAQRSGMALRGLCGMRLGGWVESIRNGLLERRTLEARVNTTRAGLCEILGLAPQAVERELEAICQSGDVKLEGDLSLVLV